MLAISRWRARSMDAKPRSRAALPLKFMSVFPRKSMEGAVGPGFVKGGASAPNPGAGAVPSRPARIRRNRVARSGKKIPPAFRGCRRGGASAGAIAERAVLDRPAAWQPDRLETRTKDVRGMLPSEHPAWPGDHR